MLHGIHHRQYYCTAIEKKDYDEEEDEKEDS